MTWNSICSNPSKTDSFSLHKRKRGLSSRGNVNNVNRQTLGTSVFQVENQGFSPDDARSCEPGRQRKICRRVRERIRVDASQKMRPQMLTSA